MSTQPIKTEVAIIGAGPGGYVAAIRAAQLGLKVTIIEAENLGGICLNWGCIPTKALLRSSEIYHLLHRLNEFGLSAKEISFDFPKIIERSRGVASKLSLGIKGLLKKNKVEVVNGFAKFLDKNTVSIFDKEGKQTATVQAQYFIIATGARAKTIPGFLNDPELVWSYREAMVAKKLPKSLLVIGSGAIGIEFASFYRTLGTEVTIVEMAPGILPNEDEEISGLARKAFEKQGMKILTSAKLKALVKGTNGVKATIEIDGKESVIESEKAILAVGVTANVENIGLEKTKVKLDKGHIATDKYLQTGEANIFAIGDCVSPPLLAHKASHEGVVAAEVIASKLAKYDAKKIHPIKAENIAGCTYSYPQIASVGLTEKKAQALGRKIKVGKFPLMGNGKSIAIGESEGLVKVIFDENGELLGAHMVGPEVTEMIQGYVIAKQAELTEEDLMATIFPHPTISESMHEAVLAAYNRVIHI